MKSHFGCLEKMDQLTFFYTNLIIVLLGLLIRLCNMHRDHTKPAQRSVRLHSGHTDIDLLNFVLRYIGCDIPYRSLQSCRKSNLDLHLPVLMWCVSMSVCVVLLQCHNTFGPLGKRKPGLMRRYQG